MIMPNSVYSIIGVVPVLAAKMVGNADANGIIDLAEALMRCGHVTSIDTTIVDIAIFEPCRPVSHERVFNAGTNIEPDVIGMKPRIEAV